MRLRLPPVLLEKERIIARVIDDDEGYARVETWTGSGWTLGSSQLFLHVFRAPAATTAQLQEHNVGPLETELEV
jgi:hypothetical protein